MIGGNGVGKTTILKMIYAATQWPIRQTDQGKTKRLVQFFSNSLKDSNALKNAENREGYCYYKVSDGILDKISAVIEGTVILENDSFYMLKNDGRKVDFSLEAEGLRKLGLLWNLIRNGLLEEGTILLWDEPEANINPELYPLVAEILLELQKNGVQIFVATHSYNFAKYLEIRRTSKEQVLFHNLYKSRNATTDDIKKAFPGINDDEAIYSQSAYRMDCSKAVWATDKMHEDYHNAGIHINDVDFLIENAENILMVEYKNACIANAENPAAFEPITDKKNINRGTKVL